MKQTTISSAKRYAPPAKTGWRERQAKDAAEALEAKKKKQAEEAAAAAKSSGKELALPDGKTRSTLDVPTSPFAARSDSKRRGSTTSLQKRSPSKGIGVYVDSPSKQAPGEGGDSPGGPESPDVSPGGTKKPKRPSSAEAIKKAMGESEKAFHRENYLDRWASTNQPEEDEEDLVELAKELSNKSYRKEMGLLTPPKSDDDSDFGNDDDAGFNWD